MCILHVVGARPNFMKVAPVMSSFQKRNGVMQTLVHTGQHYDHNMSMLFFDQLEIPKPDINLEVGSGSHAVQMAQIMLRMEKTLLDYSPDWVLVYGDVNSTVATSLVCAKLGIPLAHVEAGLRSFDRTMPEEINRLVTDQLADLLLTPSPDANENLMREGISQEKIHLVGNVMIDTLIRLLPNAEILWENGKIHNLTNDRPYGLVTLHRPSNVDDPSRISSIIEVLDGISEELIVLFPVHPRTRERFRMYDIEPKNERLCLVDPLGYLEFLALQRHATFVLTDSGGIQEETTYLGVPCLTLRENTERPVTVTMGTNILVGADLDSLKHQVNEILNGNPKLGSIPPLWDGKAGDRIAEAILNSSS